LPVEDQEEAKQTNEIGMFIPLLDGIDIQGKDITADASSRSASWPRMW